MGFCLSNPGMLLHSSQIMTPLWFQLLHTDTVCWVQPSPSKKTPQNIKKTQLKTPTKSPVLSAHFVQAVFPVF